jgi:hypothetical protein
MNIHPFWRSPHSHLRRIKFFPVFLTVFPMALTGGVFASEASSAGRIFLPEAILDRPYCLLLPLLGAEGKVDCRITQGELPPGLSLKGLSLHGTPTKIGDFLFTVQAADELGQTAQAEFQLKVGLPSADPLTIPQSSLPGCRVCTFYQVPLFCQGGYGPYQWRIVQGSLPEGLRLVEGLLTGEVRKIIDQPEHFSFQVEVKDRLQNTAVQTFSIALQPNEQIRLRVGPWGKGKNQDPSQTLPPAIVGKPYLARLPVQGGYGDVKLQCSAETLPPGLVLTESALEGTPQKVGRWNFSVTVRDSLGQQLQVPLSLQVFDPPPPPLRLISPELLPARLGEPYRADWKAEGGYPPYVWQIEGSLPSWLRFQDGVLWGTPPDQSALGEYTFTLRLQDAHGAQVSPLPVKLLVQRHPSFPPPKLLPQPLPLAIVDEPYQTLLMIQGGRPPYQMQIVQGTLPPDLRLLPSGHLTGAVRKEGNWEFGIRVSDALGQPSEDQVFRLTARRSGKAGLRLSAAPLLSGVVGKELRVQFDASGGLLPYRFSVSGDLPPGLELDPADGILHGTPTLPGAWQIQLKLQDGSPQPKELASTILLEIVPAPPWGLAGGMLVGGLFSLAVSLGLWGMLLFHLKKKTGKVPDAESPPSPILPQGQ